MNLITKEIEQSLKTGFIDGANDSEIVYQPELITNQKTPPRKVYTTLINELRTCDKFYISVAFVTTGGVAILINTLNELNKNDIKGKVLVSQYLNFTQPEALRRLLQFQNIDLRIATNVSSHTKGYIFKKKDHVNLIIGSSNLTANAISVNKEWNLKVSALHQSGIAERILGEFDKDFAEGTVVNLEFISEYEKVYKQQRLSIPENIEIPKEFITPNTMQKQALTNLKSLRNENKNKALLISATGTGKTFLSAFDAKQAQPKTLLFIVHRLNIAKKAMSTFQKIFGKEKSFGVYSGTKRDIDKDFIFSTVQTLSRETHLNQFSKEHFDYIIIDESHRSSASSYQKITEYFNPKFLLGMTATPERSDNNDIFSIFDHNIAYEIRLHKAMEEEMLCPFHYYGVTDISIEETVREDLTDFKHLVAKERVSKILEKAKFYGTDNGIIRGLIFCSRNEEAKELSKLFNIRGLKTIQISGDTSNDKREEAIALLESDDLSRKIDYIFTVDVFNEGIDIPKLNQIIMIRPTNSAIIFIQQLGRGLRKTEGKEYLTIVDFIGNHTNNYLIPIALYGDTSYNKDNLRKAISEGSKMLPGSSTINFDEITKERIFKSIDLANMKVLSDLKKDYSLLKYRLGRTPMMTDFLKYESRDPYLFVQYSKSYYNFVAKADKDFETLLNKDLASLLELFSREINNAARIEESYILKELLLNQKLEIEKCRNEIQSKYGYTPSLETIKSCIDNLNFKFIRKQKSIIIQQDDTLLFHKEFSEYLKQRDFNDFLLDSTYYSIHSFENDYKEENYRNGLILFKKYSRKDVCRLLNWEKDISSTVYGYRTNQEITPCFVTYHKSHEIEDSINYNDYFISSSVFAWESRSNRKIGSPEISNVINSKRILLFVKKGDGEGTDFYYMGDCSIIPDSIEQATMPDSKKPIVHFKFQLEQPVKEDLYTYITSNNNSEKEDLKELEIENTEETSSKMTFTIPLYDFYAAAGNFSDLQSQKTYSQTAVPEKYSLDEDYFACKVVGESMNKRIPNGAICIFKKNVQGSRSGKILLIENYDRQDPDFNSAFTVKTYASKKIVTEDDYEHIEILLKPNSFDSSYTDIIINEDNAREMHVVGEFICVLSDPTYTV
jgi:superfamily II DNA or RNA helicase/phage repressor protein C with HTH and peptisase S24 domain